MINVKKTTLITGLMALSFSSTFIASEKKFSTILFQDLSQEKTPLINSSKKALESINNLNIGLKERNKLRKLYEKSGSEYRKANTQNNIYENDKTKEEVQIKKREHFICENKLEEQNSKVYSRLKKVLKSETNPKKIKINNKYAQLFCFYETPYKSNTALEVHKIIRNFIENGADKAFCEKIATRFFEKNSKMLDFEKNIKNVEHDYYY